MKVKKGMKVVMYYGESLKKRLGSRKGQEQVTGEKSMIENDTYLAERIQ